MSADIQLPLLSEQIQELLPHRYPFLMVDRVTDFQDGEFIEGYKNVSVNEPFFSGHFPGQPVMPGVLMLEAMAQLGALYTMICTEGNTRGGLMVFSGCDKAKFRRRIVPGDQMTIHLGDSVRKGPHWKMVGTVKVGDELACQAIIKATKVEQ